MINVDANTNNPSENAPHGIPTDNRIQPSSNDPRSIAAWDVLTDDTKEMYLLHKTTRTGGTSSLASEIMNLNETFLFIVPTTDIGKITVYDAGKKFIKKNATDIYHAHPNSECEDILNMYKTYPHLKELPFLLLRDCELCKKDMRKYIRCPIIKCAIPLAPGASYTVTIPKLAAILLSIAKKDANSYFAPREDISIAERLLFQFKRTNNIIFDECHKLQSEKTSCIEAITAENGKISTFNPNQYDFILSSGKYKELQTLITTFRDTWSQENLQTSINEALAQGTNDKIAYKQKYSRLVKNEFLMEDSVEFIAAIFTEIEQLVVDLSSNNAIQTKIASIITLYNILNFAFAANIQVNYKKERIVVDLENDIFNEKVTVMTTVIDPLYNILIETFLKDMVDEGKRVILTSATIPGCYNYNKCCPPNHKIKNILFGANGDPMCTNDIFYIAPDHKKLTGKGRGSLYNKLTREEYAQRIIQVLQSYGDDKCLIVAMSKKQAQIMQRTLKKLGHPHPVDWFNSKSMIGVTSTARVMISIGMGHKPSDAYDLFTESKDESTRRRIETEHADTFQAWSRVKDPEGKVPSIVFALGCTLEQCRDVCTWGYGREVEFIQTLPRQKKEYYKCSSARSMYFHAANHTTKNKRPKDGF